MADIIQKVVFKGDTKDADKAADAFEKKMGGAMDGVAKKTLLYNEALQLGKRALGAFVGEMKKGLESARLYEQTNLRLSIAAGDMAGKLNEQSAALEAVTMVSDEAIRQHQVLAIEMGAGAEQATEFSKAAISMANATGKSADEAIRQLTKTLGGYAGELGEVIPEIKELTKEELQAGDAAALINQKFGDYLDLEARGLSGAVNNLGRGWDNVTEALGKASAKWGTLNSVIESMGTALNSVATIIEQRGALSGIGSFLDIVFLGGEGAAQLLENERIRAEIAQSRGQHEADIQGMLDKFYASRGEGYDYSLLSEGAGGGDPFGGEKIGGVEKRKGKGAGPLMVLDEGFGDEAVAGVEANMEYALELERRYNDGLAELQQGRLDYQIELTDRQITEQEKAAAARVKIADKEQQEIEAITQMGYSRLFGLAKNFSSLMIDNLLRMAEGEKVAWDQVLAEFLRGTGMKLIAQGQSDILSGISRGFTSYGFDQTATGLLAVGAAETAAGAAMVGGYLLTGAEGAATGGGGGAAGGGGGYGAGGNLSAAGMGSLRDQGTRYGGDTVIHVYGATTPEESALLIERAQMKRRQVGR